MDQFDFFDWNHDHDISYILVSAGDICCGTLRFHLPEPAGGKSVLFNNLGRVFVHVGDHILETVFIRETHTRHTQAFQPPPPLHLTELSPSM